MSSNRQFSIAIQFTHAAPPIIKDSPLALVRRLFWAVGLRIHQWRTQPSQEEFAKELGISHARLAKYELGQGAPPLGVLVILGSYQA
jgi:hypothetical protein